LLTTGEAAVVVVVVQVHVRCSRLRIIIVHARGREEGGELEEVEM
jgi:hypothetical protein